ncbi:MAG: RdgB/HAM1 family non-canonical purine NTP pyrophosphatase [Halothiobacillus sp.]
MTRIVIASHNKGKLREFEAMRLTMRPEFPALSHLEFVPISTWADEPPEETGTSFLANALIKARAAAALTGLPAIADDSGLEVAALGGAPGIFSARYAGVNASDADNNAQLLAELSAAAHADRSARFVCVLAMVRTADDPAPLIASGFWAGELLNHPRGEQGFGYDPLFFLADQGKSAAELPAELKNRISHRAHALANLMTQLGSTPF